ncbi:MAG: methylmalonyl Co-A mutase-associated GTPase MeaB [Chitinophagales bacterium]|nr:methylmalonyl Co-A mutase-associated GTPase MeaB [Chitinophagales bacterium]
MQVKKNDITSGDRIALSRAITLVESTLPEHQQQAQELIEACLPHSGNSIRIGITGVPGVGKSTFIEAFGKYIIEQGRRVAVLAIDPSSNISKGSILGDKTRMAHLANEPRAFIRPSPSGGSLGGVARRTRESIVLCEAAGFDTILIETVGVGQSETAVKGMVDFFLLLMLAGAGDELQGMKRGIMEMADMLLINKADGDNLAKAKAAMVDYKNALHLFPPNENGWIPKVDVCSALEHTGMAKVWDSIEQFGQQTKGNGHFKLNRQQQRIAWFRQGLKEMLLTAFESNPDVTAILPELEKQVANQEQDPYRAAKIAIQKFLGNNSY